MTVNVTFDTKTVFRFIGVVVVAVLGLMLLYEIRQALVIIAMSVFLALALNPPVSFIASRLPHGGRGVATAISYSVVLTLIGVILYATVPPLVSQSNELIDQLPQYIEDVTNGKNDDILSNAVNRFGLEEQLTELQDNLSAENIASAGGPIVDVVGRLSGSVISGLAVLVLTFFMLVEGPELLDRLWHIHPRKDRKRRQRLAQKMYRIVTGYVSGQLLIASIAATSALVMMYSLRLFDISIPFAVPLAAIVGIMGLIPLIGATLSAVIVTAVALFESLGAAIIMAIFFIVYQQIENNVLQPIVQSKTVEISPLSVFVAALIGINLGGLLGALFAIPVAASIRVWVNDYLSRHNRPTLEDENKQDSKKKKSATA